VLNAWRDNTINWFENPAQFEWDLLTFLSTYTKKHFRWFVGGDIPNQDFVDMMIRVGKIFPHIQFLAFTKRYKFDYRFIPSNLNIVFSAWPGLKMVNRYNRPVAWMQDGTESRIPSTAIKCSGTCENCGICWNLPCGYSVWFEKH
jgi:hypothetical protein